MSRSRKARGAETQRLVANYLRDTGLAPHAVAAGAGAPGVDIINVPDVAVEVKGRRGLDLQGWLRQTVKNADDGNLPLLISRGDGQGPASIEQWAAIMPLVHQVKLLQLIQVVRTIADATVQDSLESLTTYANDALHDLLSVEDGIDEPLPELDPDEQLELDLEPQPDANDHYYGPGTSMSVMEGTG